MKYLIAVLFCASLHAQTAKVIALSPADAVTAKQLNDEQDALTKRIAKFREGVTSRYLASTAGPTCLTVWSGTRECIVATKDGWAAGFEYSEDFRFIVPVPAKSWTSGFSNGCGVFTTTPAVSPSWIIPTSGTAPTTQGLVAPLPGSIVNMGKISR